MATRTGKIAQCPAIVKRELNRRLDDGELAPTILPWLNGLPDVQAMLAAKFEGVAISPQNLTEWRQGGYKDHLADLEAVENTKRLAEFSFKLAEASGGAIGEGAVAIAAGKILERLENLEGEAFDDAVSALVGLRRTEIETVKSRQNEKSLSQKERSLELEEKRFQRQTAELFLEWYNDKQAREVAEGKGTHEYKIQKLLPLFFAKRSVPLKG